MCDEADLALLSLDLSFVSNERIGQGAEVWRQSQSLACELGGVQIVVAVSGLAGEALIGLGEQGRRRLREKIVVLRNSEIT